MSLACKYFGFTLPAFNMFIKYISICLSSIGTFPVWGIPAKLFWDMQKIPYNTWLTGPLYFLSTDLGNMFSYLGNMFSFSLWGCWKKCCSRFHVFHSVAVHQLLTWKLRKLSILDNPIVPTNIPTSFLPATTSPRPSALSTLSTGASRASWAWAHGARRTLEQDEQVSLCKPVKL